MQVKISTYVDMPRQTRIVDVGSAGVDAMFARPDRNLDAVEQFGVPLQKQEAVASTSRQASDGVKRPYQKCEIVKSTLLNTALMLQTSDKRRCRCQ